MVGEKVSPSKDRACRAAMRLARSAACAWSRSDGDTPKAPDDDDDAEAEAGRRVELLMMRGWKVHSSGTRVLSTFFRACACVVDDRKREREREVERDVTRR